MILLAVAGYVLVQLGIAAWAARGTADDEDYLLAGRTLGVWPVAMSLFATWFAAETVLATSAEVAANGLLGARIEPFGFAAGLAVLGAVLAGPLRRGGHVTIAGYLGARFGGGAESVGAGVVALSGTVWAGAQLYAFATVLGALAGLPFALTLACVTLLVLIYTLVGGFKGDVATDVIQGAILSLGLLGLTVVVWRLAGGLGALTALAEDALRLRDPDEPWLDHAEIWLVPILGTIVSQEAVSRVLAARDEKTARRGAFLGAGLYLAVGGLPILLGLLGSTLGVTLGEGDDYFPALAEAVLPRWAYVVILGALLSAILSSVDSALLAASSVATENVALRLRPDLPPRQRLRVARGATLAAGLLAALIALSGESLRGIVIEAAAIAGVLAVPVLLGVLTGRGGPRAALLSMIANGLLYAVLGWGLGVTGAFFWSVAGALLAYAVLALRPAPAARG